MQNTGQGWSQGGGDLDRLVAPGDAPAAVAVLHQLGFSSPPGMFPRQLRSVWGRYARWAGHELSLHRPGSPWLDLHWALNTVRKPLPSFDALWLEREMVSLNGHAVPTLGRRHAFQPRLRPRPVDPGASPKEQHRWGLAGMLKARWCRLQQRLQERWQEDS